MPDDGEWSAPTSYRAKPHLRRRNARSAQPGSSSSADRGVPLSEISEDDLIDPNEGYYDYDDPAPRRQAAPTVTPQPAARPAGAVRARPVGAGPARPAASRRRRRRLVILLLVLALIAYPVTLAQTALSSLTRVDALSTMADTPGRTFLIVGSDSRAGTDFEAVEGNRTDTIMMLHVPRRGPVVMMSIPRDSEVDIPGHGTNKINASFAIGGPQLLVETVEENTGVKIDGYVETGLAGFGDIVDAVGGVTVCPTRAMDDPMTGLDIQPGCQDVDGATALKYARSRYEDPLGDLGRVQRQREVLSAIMSKAGSPLVLINPFSSYPLARSGGKALTVDEKFGLTDMGYLFWGMRQANGSGGISLTVPVGGTRNTRHGNVVRWDEAQSQTVFQALQDSSTSAIEPIAEQQKAAAGQVEGAAP